MAACSEQRLRHIRRMLSGPISPLDAESKQSATSAMASARLCLAVGSSMADAGQGGDLVALAV